MEFGADLFGKCSAGTPLPSPVTPIPAFPAAPSGPTTIVVSGVGQVIPIGGSGIVNTGFGAIGQTFDPLPPEEGDEFFLTTP